MAGLWPIALAVAVLGITCVVWPRSQPPPNKRALPSVLLPAYTNHARSLPVPSRHTFSYPLLYAAIDIDEAEAGLLYGAVFSYGGHPATNLLGLRSNGYLAKGSEGLRAKLEALLASRGLELASTDRAWLVTMPSCLGFEGINPLSVWYIYRQKELHGVVLEVHNTFGEKHAYVLQHDCASAHEPAASYTHAWTFPRSFHVSPFNSRDGYYRLDLSDPLKASIPKVKISLRLLTPDKTQKLHATLMSHASRQPVPLQGLPALRMLMRYPFDLFFTTPRILYHAYKLHYEKKLLVFPRPEPFSDEGTSWNGRRDDHKGIGRTVGWQGQGWVEKASEASIKDWRTLPLQVEFTYDRPSVTFDSDADAKDVISVRTNLPNFFTLLVGSSSIQHFIAVAQVDGHTTFSSTERFAALFPPRTQSPSHLDKLADALRARHLAFFLSFTTTKPSLPITPHFHPTTFKTLIILVIPYLADKAEYRIMKAVGAQFVPGTEPWSVWAGILGGDAVEDDGLGSIRYA